MQASIPHSKHTIVVFGVRLAVRVTHTCLCLPCNCLRLQRGLSAHLARQVAEELTATDVVRAHARDELGIDIDELANPFQVGGCADAVAGAATGQFQAAAPQWTAVLDKCNWPWQAMVGYCSHTCASLQSSVVVGASLTCLPCLLLSMCRCCRPVQCQPLHSPLAQDCHCWQAHSLRSI